MEPPKFALRQVEAILADTFQVTEAKRKTFAARLHQLQGLKLPQGINVGRGIKAEYAGWHLAEIALYLVLLDAGVPPAQLVSHFAQSPFYLSLAMCGFGNEIENANPNVMALIYFASLDYLRESGERSSHDIYLHTDPDMFVSTFAIEPGVAVNLTSLLSRLRPWVAKHVPDMGGRPLLAVTSDDPAKLPGKGEDGIVITVGRR